MSESEMPWNQYSEEEKKIYRRAYTLGKKRAFEEAEAQRKTAEESYVEDRQPKLDLERMQPIIMEQPDEPLKGPEQGAGADNPNNESLSDTDSIVKKLGSEPKIGELDTSFKNSRTPNPKVGPEFWTCHTCGTMNVMGAPCSQCGLTEESEVNKFSKYSKISETPM